MLRPFAIAMVIAAMPGSSHADTFVVASGHYTIQQSSQIAFTVSQVGGGGLGGSFGEFTGNLELDAQISPDPLYRFGSGPQASMQGNLASRTF